MGQISLGEGRQALGRTPLQCRPSHAIRPARAKIAHQRFEQFFFVSKIVIQGALRSAEACGDARHGCSGIVAFEEHLARSVDNGLAPPVMFCSYAHYVWSCSYEPMWAMSTK